MSTAVEQKAKNMEVNGYDEKVLGNVACREYPDFSIYNVYGVEVEIRSLSDLAMSGGFA